MEICTETETRFSVAYANYVEIPFWGGDNNEIAAGFGWWFVDSCS